MAEWRACSSGGGGARQRVESEPRRELPATGAHEGMTCVMLVSTKTRAEEPAHATREARRPGGSGTVAAALPLPGQQSTWPLVAPTRRVEPPPHEMDAMGSVRPSHLRGSGVIFREATFGGPRVERPQL